MPFTRRRDARLRCLTSGGLHSVGSGNRGGDKFLQLLLDLCEYPIAGCFEDTLWQNDIQGYEELRKAVPRPIVSAAPAGPGHPSPPKHASGLSSEPP